MKNLLVLVVLVLSNASFSGVSVSCVPKDTPNARIVAMAMGDSLYVSENSVANVEQETTIEVSKDNGLEDRTLSHSARVTQSGKVFSSIAREWVERGQLCVELVFSD